MPIFPCLDTHLSNTLNSSFTSKLLQHKALLIIFIAPYKLIKNYKPTKRCFQKGSSGGFTANYRQDTNKEHTTTWSRSWNLMRNFTSIGIIQARVACDQLDQLYLSNWDNAMRRADPPDICYHSELSGKPLLNTFFIIQNTEKKVKGNMIYPCFVKVCINTFINPAVTSWSDQNKTLISDYQRNLNPNWWNHSLIQYQFSSSYFHPFSSCRGHLDYKKMWSIQTKLNGLCPIHIYLTYALWWSHSSTPHNTVLHQAVSVATALLIPILKFSS